MRLKIGKMKTAELAEWFNVSYGTFRNNSQKYWNTLLDYCNYEKVYGGANILEIYLDTYDKNLDIKSHNLYLEEIKECVKKQDGLSTISGMARKFVRNKTGNFDDLRQAARRMSKAGKELFGDTKELTSTGSAGSREYVWAIKIDNYNHYRLMTQEENDQFNSIISQSYSSSPEKVKKLKLLEKSLERDEITKDEFFETKERLKLDPFVDAIFTFRDQTGYMVVRCTKHELLESLKLAEEEQNKEEEIIPEEKE